MNVPDSFSVVSQQSTLKPMTELIVSLLVWSWGTTWIRSEEISSNVDTSLFPCDMLSLKILPAVLFWASSGRLTDTNRTNSAGSYIKGVKRQPLMRLDLATLLFLWFTGRISVAELKPTRATGRLFPVHTLKPHLFFPQSLKCLKYLRFLKGKKEGHYKSPLFVRCERERNKTYSLHLILKGAN